ncbi:MAG: hypothetical protein ACRCWJ_01300 [Casimicrobium sp.]
MQTTAATPLIIETEPKSPRAFEPFDVIIRSQSGEQFCIREDIGPVGDVISEVNKLRLFLTSFDLPCDTTYRLRLPGTKAGEFVLHLARTVPSVADAYFLSPRPVVVAESAHRVAIEPALTANPVLMLDTGATTLLEFEDSYGRGFFFREAMNVDPSYLYSAKFAKQFPLFYAWKVAALGSGAPTEARSVYKLTLPSNANGSREFVIYTMSTAEAEGLAQSGWAREAAFAAMPSIGGNGCLAGLRPIYRLFNVKSLRHRYVSNIEHYNVLIANGWAGEGVSWCSPTQ